MALKDFSRGFQNFNRLVRAIRIRGDRSLFWRPAAAREALATSIFANTMPPDLIPEDPESAWAISPPYAPSNSQGSPGAGETAAGKAVL